jgi:ribosomal RNA methyltransferase Nop2
MGRRAKNKQGAPEPLEPKVWTTPRKLGKRKADAEAEVDGKASARPTKKSKESNGKVKPKVKAKETGRDKSGPTRGKGTKVVEDESGAVDSVDGWENIENADLKSQAK